MHVPKYIFRDDKADDKIHDWWEKGLKGQLVMKESE